MKPADHSPPYFCRILISILYNNILYLTILSTRFFRTKRFFTKSIKLKCQCVVPSFSRRAGKRCSRRCAQKASSRRSLGKRCTFPGTSGVCRCHVLASNCGVRGLWGGECACVKKIESSFAKQMASKLT